ncbi:hypothetical protein N665_0003s0039 [Sinapis alba]|nr:hypothetical protein N665_0003s0039 [Sinapis alba]
MEAFEEKFKRGYTDWQIFKNKYDTSRKRYTKFKKLTYNRTGIGFDDMGRIDMSDDRWNEREKEYPGIRKSVCKEIANWDLFEEEFRGVVITGSEGWSAHHGEASLSSRVGGDDRDEGDSFEMQAEETQAPEETQAQKQTQSESSREKRKRKEKDMAVDACLKRTEVLEVKNMIAERMLEREEACSIENVLGIMNALPGVIEWSPLYNAAVELLLDNEASRRGFITFQTNEAKIRCLKMDFGR